MNRINSVIISIRRKQFKRRIKDGIYTSASKTGMRARITLLELTGVFMP